MSELRNRGKPYAPVALPSGGAGHALPASTLDGCGRMPPHVLMIEGMRYATSPLRPLLRSWQPWVHNHGYVGLETSHMVTMKLGRNPTSSKRSGITSLVGPLSLPPA